MKRCVWIAWEDQIRNVSMSSGLGAKLFVLLSSRGRLMRYMSCSCRTVAILWRERPSVVFAPNPSIVLTYLLLAMKYAFQYKFVIDAHFAGVVAPRGHRLFQGALDFANRRADLVIVTNDAHKRCVEALGGTSIACEDPLPEIGRYIEFYDDAVDRKTAFFICSFDVDEPYLEAFEAARLLRGDGYSFLVSGKYQKAGIDPAVWPEVMFMGFVPTRDFYEKLASSDVVIDLTNQDNCLLCGAYEAMALEKPLVTSNQPALRDYFAAGTVFVEHSAEEIAAGVRSAYEKRGALRAEIKRWKELANQEISRKLESVSQQLEL